jgi:hypothetical protein
MENRAHHRRCQLRDQMPILVVTDHLAGAPIAFKCSDCDEVSPHPSAARRQLVPLTPMGLNQPSHFCFKGEGQSGRFHFRGATSALTLDDWPGSPQGSKTTENLGQPARTQDTFEIIR